MQAEPAIAASPEHCLHVRISTVATRALSWTELCRPSLCQAEFFGRATQNHQDLTMPAHLIPREPALEE
jgi:hypothetical protein